LIYLLIRIVIIARRIILAVEFVHKDF